MSTDTKKTAVLKFGGSSVADSARMMEVAKIIKTYVDNGYRTAVIVSAMGNTTNQLLELAGGISDELHNREIDQLLATGEQQSIALLALALKRAGVPAVSFTAAQAGFFAKGFPLEGRIFKVDPSAVNSALDKGLVAVVAGFQGVTDEGDIITLGRGGSDLSAVALAAALGGECRILKDVAGVYTADPRIIADPVKLDYLTYGECMELSTLGAKMLQSRSVEMAERFSVPLYVGSSFVNEEGTWIVKNNTSVSEGLIIKGVVCDNKSTRITMMGVPDRPGIACKLFTSLSERGIGIEMIIQNNMRGGVNDIGFLVKKEFLDGTIDVCDEFSRSVGAQGVSFNSEISRVSIVGAGIANHPEIPSRMFSVLAKEEINIDMIASTALSVTCVVALNRADDAVRALHAHFIEEAEDQ